MTMRVPADNGSLGNAGRRTGGIAGVFVRFDFQGSLALQPELLYVQKGTSDNLQWDGRDATRTRRFDYLEIPVLAKYEFSFGGSTVTPNLQGGPTLGINVVSRDELNKDATGKPEVVFKGTASRITAGLTVGTGFDFHLNGRALSLDTRYSFGLTDALKGNTSAYVRSQGLVVAIGFTF